MMEAPVGRAARPKEVVKLFLPKHQSAGELCNWIGELEFFTMRSAHKVKLYVPGDELDANWILTFESGRLFVSPTGLLPKISTDSIAIATLKKLGEFYASDGGELGTTQDSA